jgi:tyrosyl-tRNA synthetase
LGKKEVSVPVFGRGCKNLKAKAIKQMAKNIIKEWIKRIIYQIYHFLTFFTKKSKGIMELFVINVFIILVKAKGGKM